MKLWQALIAAALFWAAAFLPSLGTPELKGEEGRRVLPARNMLEAGDWAVPHVGGRPYSRKPPLLNWLVAGTFKATGVQNGWTARLPSVLSLLALAGGLVWCCHRWPSAGARSGSGSGAGHRTAGGAAAGFAAVVFALGNFAMLDKGRLAELEPLYVALTGLAFASWTALWMRGSSPWVPYTVPWVFLGLGVLAKGPLHLFFFYAPVVGVLVASRRWRELLTRAHAAGLGVVALVAGPWALVHRARVSDLEPEGDGAGGVWLRQATGRLWPEDFSFVDWVKTPFEAAVDFLPWTVPLAFLWWRISRRRWHAGPHPELPLGDDRAAAWARGTAWGVGVSALVVALVPASEARYCHPAIPAAALLLAYFITSLDPAQRLYGQLVTGWKRCNRVLLFLLGPLLLLAPPVVLFWGDWRFSAVWFALGCLACFGCVAAGVRLSGRTAMPPQITASACLIAGASIFYASVVVPWATSRDNVRPVGEEVAALVPDGARLCVLNPGIEPFLFYLEPGYSVVDRPSRVPAATTHVLATRRVYDKARDNSHFQSFTFVERTGDGTTATIRDKDDVEWVLLEATKTGS